MQWVSRPRVAVVLGATVVVTALGLGGWRVSTLRDDALRAQQHLVAARGALSSPLVSDGGQTPAAGAGLASSEHSAGRLAAACTETASANAALQRVHGDLDLVLPLVGALDRSAPSVFGQARAQSDALRVGTELAGAGAALCDGLQPLSAALSAAPSAGSAAQAGGVLQQVAAARPPLIDATGRLEHLQATLESLGPAQVDGASAGELDALRGRLPEVIHTLRDSTALLGLLGQDQPRRYLLVSQNPDELRATGGYIGSAGVIEVRAGTLKLLDYGTSRAYDTPPSFRVVPPAPYAPYLGSGYWNFAGANWEPSFPDVARQLTYFYSLSHPGQPIDGVIALDQDGLGLLLNVIGPVDVAEYGETVSADTLDAALDRYVHAGDSRDERGRKQFTAALSVAVIQDVLAAPADQLPAIVGAVRTALDQQHLLLSVTDPDAARVLAERRWDGRLLDSGSGDALLLADTDVSSSKQSQSVERQASYHVDLGAAGGPRATLTVTYVNRSDRAARPGVDFVPVYRDFLQVYVPAGAALESAEGFDDPSDTRTNCGRTVFGGEFGVATGQQHTVVLRYRLPARLQDAAAYTLLLQQQPGVPPGQTQVSVTGASGEMHVDAPNERGRHVYVRATPGPDGSRLVSAPLPLEQTTPCTEDQVAAQPIAPPARLDIPELGVSAAVVELGVGQDGVMEAPETPDVAGWYRMSARAGQPGNSVMAGHVDWGKNTAVFWGLRDLAPGDRVVVHGADGQDFTYAVTWNRLFPSQGAVPADVIAGTPDATLTLITCDGVYDRTAKDYSLRRVVRAALLTG